MNEDKLTDILFDSQRPATLSPLGLLTVLAALVAPDGIGFYFLVGALAVTALQSFHALRGWFRMKALVAETDYDD
jgi:hypothetical protein